MAYKILGNKYIATISIGPADPVDINIKSYVLLENKRIQLNIELTTDNKGLLSTTADGIIIEHLDEAGAVSFTITLATCSLEDTLLSSNAQFITAGLIFEYETITFS